MRKISRFHYLLISFLIIIADQVTKILIVKNLAENESVPILGDLLHIRFIYNEGGAMGTSLGPAWLYMVLTLAALFLIIRYFVISKPDGFTVKLSLALILGGAIGNLIDRILYGKVIDFIDVDFPDIPAIGLYRWYTFNIADAAISVGLVLFAITIFFKRKSPEESLVHATQIQSPEINSETS
jgi:signal peptidase II